MSEMSPEERAKQINLALLIHSGIGEVDAGFDTVVTLTDKGLSIIAQAIREAEDAAYEQAAGICECDHDRHGTEEIAEMIRALKHQSA